MNIKKIKRKINNKFRNKSLDIDMRYIPIVKYIKKNFDEPYTILEVGSGSLGITPYIKKKITGLDIKFEKINSRYLKKVKGTATDIPFKNSSFDIVINVDTLEHLNKKERYEAVKEMSRVSKDKIIIAVPCGKKSEILDRYVRDLTKNNFGKIDFYIEEHIQNGLPNSGELKGIYKKCKLKLIKVVNNYPIWLRYAGVYFFFTKNKNKIRVYYLMTMLSPLLERIRIGTPYRKIFILEK